MEQCLYPFLSTASQASTIFFNSCSFSTCDFNRAVLALNFLFSSYMASTTPTTRSEEEEEEKKLKNKGRL
jgi:hypothetical protein